MDGTNSPVVGRLWPNPSDGATCTMLSGDQVWLEELIGPLFCQSSSSQPSSRGDLSYSVGGSRSSSENSWSSGATSVLHSSIKQQSQKAFQSRLRAGRCRKKAGRPSVGLHTEAKPQVEQRGGTGKRPLHTWPERVGLSDGRYSAPTRSSSSGAKAQWLLEEKLDARLRFSKFLDEVTSNVFDTNSLQALGKAVSQCRFIPGGTKRPGKKVGELTEWSPGLLCSMALQPTPLPELEMTKEEQTHLLPPQKTYLETDIDTVRTDAKLPDLDGKAEAPHQQETDERHIIPPPPQFCQGFQMKSPFPEFHCHFPRYPYKSVSLPRGIDMVSNESLPSL